jgi:hypothetical protein
MIARVTLVVAALAATVTAQESSSIDGRPVVVLSNDKLSVAMREQGGAMVRLLLADDPTGTNPMHTGLGHFVCVDGFGPASAEERKAGLPMHGEANRVPWQMTSAIRANGTLSVSFAAHLPLVHENFRRTIHLVDGESVVYIESELESLLAFDRPINWGEHATIGPPFLELGKTVVEMSARRAMTRSYDSQSANPPHRLADFKEFTWPMAPGANGDSIDVRPAPSATPVGDHTTSLMDPSRRLVFVTAFHADRQLLLGYLFRREEFPWTQLWENYPASGRLARGLEFAVQPFDMPRRDVISQHRLLDAPTYRWLPAKSTVTTAFLMFYTRTPDGMRQVSDVRLESGRIVVEDQTTGARLSLAASRGL